LFQAATLNSFFNDELRDTAAEADVAGGPLPPHGPQMSELNVQPPTATAPMMFVGGTDNCAWTDRTTVDSACIPMGTSMIPMAVVSPIMPTIPELDCSGDADEDDTTKLLAFATSPVHATAGLANLEDLFERA